MEYVKLGLKWFVIGFTIMLFSGTLMVVSYCRADSGGNRYLDGYWQDENPHLPGYVQKDNRYLPGYVQKDNRYLDGYQQNSSKHLPGYVQDENRYLEGYKQEGYIDWLDTP